MEKLSERMSRMFFSKVCKKGVTKKLVGALLLTMSLSVIGCGSSTTTESGNTEATEGSETTENNENTDENAEAEEVMYRVIEIKEDTITVNEMNFGKGRGERPEGEMPEGEKPDGEMPEGEMPEGEMPEGEMPEGEMPEGEMPKGEMPEGERPEGKMPEGEMPEDAKEKMGEEKTILVSEDTVIKKENEDGTIETCTISDLAEGDMLSITGEEGDDGISATEITVKNMQGFERGDKKMPQGEDANAQEGEASEGETSETEEAEEDSQA